MDDRRFVVFRGKVWEFFRDHGRAMPWREDPAPYNVFISEIMLQQTQVARVLVKYVEWLERFPDFESLASAPTADVLAAWSGLGYNRRALWTHRAAQAIVENHGGVLPSEPADLVKLPGVGPNTAGSMAAFAYDAPVVFIETNIRRVFIHEFFPESELGEEPVADRQLLPLIKAALDCEHPRQWYYALMDYGADLSRRLPNPNRRSRHYAVQSKFDGSLRQLRGEVLRRLLDGPKTEGELRTGAGKYSLEDTRLDEVMRQLQGEGFVATDGLHYRLA